MSMPSYLSGAVFTKAYKVLREHVVACLSRYELSPTSWSFLGAVMDSPDGIRPVIVAQHLSVKAPLITVLSRNLIARDLVKLMPHHLDGRAKLLVITPKGKKYVQAVEKDMEQTLHRLLEGLTQDDLGAYRKVLETIIANDARS
jgi:DNA-binding MarR family transcriptional regulator